MSEKKIKRCLRLFRPGNADARAAGAEHPLPAGPRTSADGAASAAFRPGSSFSTPAAAAVGTAVHASHGDAPAPAHAPPPASSSRKLLPAAASAARRVDKLRQRPVVDGTSLELGSLELCSDVILLSGDAIMEINLL